MSFWSTLGNFIKLGTKKFGMTGFYTFVKIWDYAKALGFINVIGFVAVFLMILPSIQYARISGNYLFPVADLSFKIATSETNIAGYIASFPDATTKWQVMKIYSYILGSLWLWFKMFRFLRKYVSISTGKLIETGFPAWLLVIPAILMLEFTGLILGGVLGHPDVTLERAEYSIINDKIDIPYFTIDPYPMKGFVSLWQSKDVIFDSFVKVVRIFEPFTPLAR